MVFLAEKLKYELFYGVKSLCANCVPFMQGTGWTKHCLDSKGEEASGWSGDRRLRNNNSDSKWISTRHVTVATTSGLQTTIFQHFCNSCAVVSRPANLCLGRFRLSQPFEQVNCSLFSFLLHLCSCGQLLWPLTLPPVQEPKVFIGPFL